MPFVEGQTLQQLVEQKGKLDYETAVNYMAQIAEAVDYIHTRDILHRDIKPENIIITPENKAVLIDFGSAREFIHDKTQQHTSIYTQGYAPLEQYAANSRKGSYSDIYSLGATFYFALTGEKPMDAATRTMETMAEPKALVPEIPEEANRTIIKAMELKPEDRQQRVGEFMGDLLNAKPKMHTANHKKKSTKNKKWKTPLIILLYIVLYGISVGVFIDQSDHYIWRKEARLEKEAQQSLKNFFKDQDQYIDDYYSNHSVKYTESAIHKIPPSKNYLDDDDFYKRVVDNWKEQFSDIYKSFEIDDTYDGWRLFVAKKDGDSKIWLSSIYPSYVGYRKQDNSYSYNWIPSVEDCVKEAYEFWVSNPKSQYIDDYKKGNKRIVENFIADFGNDYFSMELSDDKSSQRHTETVFGTAGSGGYMYNGYYKVFAEKTYYDEIYEIMRNDNKIDRDIEELHTNGIIIISCFFIVVMGIHVFIYRRKR
jgi:serine/threonine protein kinase